MSADETKRSGDDPSHIPVDQDRTRGAETPTPQSPSIFEDDDNHLSLPLNETAVEHVEFKSKFHADNLPISFAQYTLVQFVGEGGAGVVFRATPHTNNSNAQGFESVAIKMIRPEFITSKKVALRFEKESRLHAAVDSPYITKHFEFGCEKGRYFIASEFIDGVELNSLIDQFATMPAKVSLRVIADVLRALSALHCAGVVHRDVKPANVIVRFRNQRKNHPQPQVEDFEIAKLTDFGLARHIQQSESMAMTRQRAMLGTPLYMAPEQQFESRAVDARADVYSAGITLYHMLAGHAPFDADNMQTIAEQHREERPTPLRFVRPEISEAVSNVVMKALEKQPDLRYANATEMLKDVQRLLDDQPTSIRLYPEIPDTKKASVKKYVFQWTLDATTKQLWPLVADTDRFNQAIGLPTAEFTFDHSSKQRKIFAKTNFNGMTMRWREHPFQWICEREMSVLREFETGPFEWVTSTVELFPLADQKTRLIHRFQIKPRGWFGKLFTPFQFNFMTRRALDRVYPQLEKIANDKSCGFACDVPFGKPPRLSKLQRHRLNQRCKSLAPQLRQPRLAKQLGDLLCSVADSMAARIRPIPLSQKLDCAIDDSVELCLAAVENGILNMTWDVICPVCRVAAQNCSTLSKIESHANCEVCNLNFKVEFSQSVEAVFCINQEIRNVDLKTYCIGGPFHAPHVLAQNRLRSNQQIEIGAELSEGKYEIRGPQLDEAPQLDVQQNAEQTRAKIRFGNQHCAGSTQLRVGAACIQIENQSDLEILVRLEQLQDRQDALTAGRASEHPLFQKLFPEDLSNFKNLVELTNVYLLAIEHLQSEALLESVGELEFRQIWNRIQNLFLTAHPNCKIVEHRHSSVLISFGQMEDLVTALLSFSSKTESEIGFAGRQCALAINAGEVMTGHQGNQPATFGKTVRNTWKLLDQSQPGSIAVPQSVFATLQMDAVENAQLLLADFLLDSDASTDGVVLLKRVVR